MVECLVDRPFNRGMIKERTTRHHFQRISSPRYFYHQAGVDVSDEYTWDGMAVYDLLLSKVYDLLRKAPRLVSAEMQFATTTLEVRDTFRYTRTSVTCIERLLDVAK